MPRAARADGLDKFQRYRASRRASGMKLLRVWVPDPLVPGCQAEAHRQAMILRGASEEGDALDLSRSLRLPGPVRRRAINGSGGRWVAEVASPAVAAGERSG